jgi:hypothetical protein
MSAPVAAIRRGRRGVGVGLQMLLVLRGKIDYEFNYGPPTGDLWKK